MRVAIYYTPPAGHKLARAGAEWLGRDPFAEPETGLPVTSGRDGVGELTAEPRRYGFHATVKAPFRLADGRTLDELAAALGAFCSDREAPRLGPLRIADLENFTALAPDGPRPALDALAADAVRNFEPFRAPLSPEELARRLTPSLTARQEEHLRLWGYPYVFEEFRFHMTLTGRVAEARRPAVIEMLQGRFNGLLDAAPRLDCLALFVEPEPRADFSVHTLIRFGDRTGLS